MACSRVNFTYPFNRLHQNITCLGYIMCDYAWTCQAFTKFRKTRFVQSHFHSGWFTFEKGQFHVEGTAAVSVDRGPLSNMVAGVVGSPDTCSSTHALFRLVEVESLLFLYNRCLFHNLATPVLSNKLTAGYSFWGFGYEFHTGKIALVFVQMLLKEFC
jgi:hypothetical protein